MSFKHKVVSTRYLKHIAEEWQCRNLKVVQCHGCYDILHVGHIHHLSWAKEQGDILLVTITPDVEIHKGEGRPIFPQDKRAEALAALEFVNFVAIDAWPSAMEILDLIRPDIYVKGWDVKEHPTEALRKEVGFVEGYGGRVLYSPGYTTYHSTDILKILEKRMHGKMASL